MDMSQTPTPTKLCACGCGAEVQRTWKHGHNPRWQGRTLTPEHREKIRLSNIGKQAGVRHPNWGKHLSAETRKKIGDARRGRTTSPGVRKRISAAKLAQGVSEKPHAIHKWLNLWHPREGKCERCGC